MASPPLAVMGVGLVSGVGLTAEESCAAIRCGVNNFQETQFIGNGGDWLVGSSVQLEQAWHGAVKLAKMASRAIAECLAAAGDAPRDIPVLVCTAEVDRPGGFEGLASLILEDIERELGARFHPHSRVIEQGRVGAAVALLQARRLLVEGRHSQIIVCGVDSFLTGATLAAYDRDDRLLTAGWSNGFIPGEASGAFLLAAWRKASPSPLLLRGLGFAREPAPFGSGKPLRAEGLVQAVRAALSDADVALKDCDHRVTDMNGEQYRFKEGALAITRLLRDRKDIFSVWHPSDCIGEVGAATLPAIIAMLYAGARKDYLPGHLFLGHLGNDDDKRAALVIEALTEQSLSLEIASESDFRQRRGMAV